MAIGHHPGGTPDNDQVHMGRYHFGHGFCVGSKGAPYLGRPFSAEAYIRSKITAMP